MQPSFSSPFWHDVRRVLERAPPMAPGLGVQRVLDTQAARRLLENRLDCVRRAINQADGETQRRLRQTLTGLDTDAMAAELLVTLKEAVLIVGASVGLGGAFGVGMGSVLGGVGAVPGAALGAALGAKVGMWLLGVLGLAALAEFFLGGLPAILRCYHEGFSLAWQAGRDALTDSGAHRWSQQSSQIFTASNRIADGHAALVLLLLSAIVAWLTQGAGRMPALAQQAATGRLGPGFAQWLLQYEEALRKHPALQPRQRRPAEAQALGDMWGDGLGGEERPDRPG